MEIAKDGEGDGTMLKFDPREKDGREDTVGWLGALDDVGTPGKGELGEVEFAPVGVREIDGSTLKEGTRDVTVDNVGNCVLDGALELPSTADGSIDIVGEIDGVFEKFDLTGLLDGSIVKFAPIGIFEADGSEELEGKVDGANGKLGK